MCSSANSYHLLHTTPKPLKYSATSFDDFAELISIIVTDFERVIITGDFNIHADFPLSLKTLDSFSM